MCNESDVYAFVCHGADGAGDSVTDEGIDAGDNGADVGSEADAAVCVSNGDGESAGGDDIDCIGDGGDKDTNAGIDEGDCATIDDCASCGCDADTCFDVFSAAIIRLRHDNFFSAASASMADKALSITTDDGTW